MKKVSAMSPQELLGLVAIEIESEDDLGEILKRAAELAIDSDPSLSLMMLVLADMPSEIAGVWAKNLEGLSAKLDRFSDGDGALLAMVASRALAQFVEE